MESSVDMVTVPLKMGLTAADDGIRPRDWQPKRSSYKVPLRLLRLCVLGILLPAILVAGPIYIRFRVYSEQLYPLAASDQRLIDSRISTTWCQRQIVKANATFNAYLMGQKPRVRMDAIPISMTRHLSLDDDMKEYWGFYLLRGSSVTVSTCVRWPGASLTMIRGHKHLHECAFIGDDSSEELEELLEVAEERGLLKINSSSQLEDGPSNEPEKMKRVRQGVRFHLHEGLENDTVLPNSHHLSSHELDAEAMRNILTQLFIKKLGIQKKKKTTEKPHHHHYEGVYREDANIDKPPINIDPEPLGAGSGPHRPREESTPGGTVTAEPKDDPEADEEYMTSEEIFQDVLKKLSSLGPRGKELLRKLYEKADGGNSQAEVIARVIEDTRREAEDLPMDEANERAKRQLVLSSPLHEELNREDLEADLGIEEDLLNPDGIAEDRGSVNESTLNDRSNSEFWSSFSSSEERLLECKGLILNLPLTPHRRCSAKHEDEHTAASVANTITYRVPTNGYYFFVFSSENEVQTNYLRVRFDLLKTMYDTSNPIRECKNSTRECSLQFNFFSDERTVLELPLTGNDSQWNEEYVVVSTCEPRTAIYLLCSLAVPFLILMFAFH